MFTQHIHPIQHYPHFCAYWSVLGKGFCWLTIFVTYFPWLYTTPFMTDKRLLWWLINCSITCIKLTRVYRIKSAQLYSWIPPCALSHIHSHPYSHTARQLSNLAPCLSRTHWHSLVPSTNWFCAWIHISSACLMLILLCHPPDQTTSQWWPTPG